MARLAPPDTAALSPLQQEVYDAIAASPRGGVRGPLAVWLHRSQFAGPAQTLGAYCRYHTSLPPAAHRACDSGHGAGVGGRI